MFLITLMTVCAKKSVSIFLIDKKKYKALTCEGIRLDSYKYKGDYSSAAKRNHRSRII